MITIPVMFKLFDENDTDRPMPTLHMSIRFNDETDLPNWPKFIGIDMDGDVCLFEHDIKPNATYWQHKDNEGKVLKIFSIGRDIANWTSTKREIKR